MSFATRGSYQGQTEDRCHVISESQATWELGSSSAAGTLWWCAAAPRARVLWGRWGLDVRPDSPCPPWWSTYTKTRTSLIHRSPCSVPLVSIYLASPNTNGICLRSSINVHGRNEGRLEVRWQTHYSRGAGSLGLRFKVRELYLTLSSPIYFIRMQPPRLCKMGSKIFCTIM